MRMLDFSEEEKDIHSQLIINDLVALDDHEDDLVPEDDHISALSQTFLIEHTKNHITERTNEDSTLS